jgi:hypothetical protein
MSKSFIDQNGRFTSKVIVEEFRRFDIRSENGFFVGSVEYEVILSDFLYPHVFVKEFIGAPSVMPNGLCYPSAPHSMQLAWLKNKNMDEWERTILAPYFANLLYWKINGVMAVEPNNGIGGIIESIEDFEKNGLI